MVEGNHHMRRQGGDQPSMLVSLPLDLPRRAAGEQRHQHSRAAYSAATGTKPPPGT